MYWIYDIPNWTLGVVCIAAFVAFGLLGLHTTRDLVRRVHREDHSHNDIVGYYLAAVTVFYGVTLGLVAVGTWNNYLGVQDKVDKEAQDVASLYRAVSGFPQPQSTVLVSDLRAYVREVIDHSWPEQRRGVVPRNSAPYMDRLALDLRSFTPQTMQDQVIYMEAYKQYDDLVESRRSRLDAVSTSIPASLWWLVIVGALVSIIATLFFHTRSFSMHACMTGLMSGLLGLMIFLIATLDNPFRGKVSIGPQPLERVYEQLK